MDNMIKSHHNSVENSILEALEQLWGYKLPKDYRKFLLKYNGGEFEKDIFYFKNAINGSDVRKFFCIYKDDNYNLLSKIEYIGNRIPQNCFPIATDSFGNLILISVKNLDRGKIYFWDHELECNEGETPDYSNLTLIADSFEEFINSLHNDHETRSID